MNPPTPPNQPVEDAIPQAQEASTETGTLIEETAAPAVPEGVDVLSTRLGRVRKPADAIRPHDFRQAGFLGPSELRRLRQRHEQFVRALAARLAIFLRVEFTVQFSRLQIVGYQKLVENLPSPTHISLFKTEPLKGKNLLIIPPRLALSLVDRLLGGAGQMPEASRELSEIEVALINQVAILLITEWCNHWPELRDWRPTLLGHENNSRFLQTAPTDTAMLELTLNAGFGETLETIQMVFPYATVEPLVRLLSSAGTSESDGPAPRPARLRWNPELDEMPVPIVAAWQGLKLSAGDITRLRSGDVLMLDAKSASQVQLRLNEIPKFFGRPGTRAGKWAVELTAPVITK